MRANPQADWRIDDIQAVCRAHGLSCSAPTRGDHYKISHAAVAEILTIPAHRPIKAIYIKKLVALVDLVEGQNGD